VINVAECVCYLHDPPLCMPMEEFEEHLITVHPHVYKHLQIQCWPDGSKIEIDFSKISVADFI
jgi:hypothetical protein